MIAIKAGVNRKVSYSIIGILALVNGCTASATDKKTDKPKAELALGYFVTFNDSTAQLDSTNYDIGSQSNLENDLGMSKTNETLRADATLRFSETGKSRLDFSYYSISRKSNHYIIDSELNFGESVYPVEADLSSAFKGRFYKAGYTHMFINEGMYELGASLGLFLASLNMNISDEDLGVYNIEKADIDAPLPTLGLRAGVRLSDKVQVAANADIFFLPLDDTKGHMYDLKATAEYELTEHAGLGIGFNSVELDVDLTNSWREFLGNWNYDGAYLFMNFKY